MQSPAKYAYLLTRQLEAHEAQYAAEWQIRETRANETSSALRRAIESKLRGRRAEEAEALRLDILVFIQGSNIFGRGSYSKYCKSLETGVTH